MIMTRFLKLTLASFLVGTLACSAVAAPANSVNNKNAALIDEAEDTSAKAPQAKPDEGAKKEAATAAPEEKKPECTPAPAEESGGFPVVPVVFSAISTIAFIVLAIIF